MWKHLLFEAAALALAPERCAACDEPVRMLTVFCPACVRTVVRAPAPSSTVLVAPFLYGGALATAITRFKYQRRPDLARPLSALLARAVSVLAKDAPDVVVPVPLHPSRLAERGYNQAALLARPVARALGARFGPLALARTRETEKQAVLDREARLQNLAGAFLVRAARDVAIKRVLLVDDVRTTGATLRACEDALTAAGASTVTCAVLALA
jgi:ComF family protein